MAIGASSVWRIRVSGNNANGGGYDATISGAGTDYTDQDAAQLSLTDIVTVGSTTVTSVTGGFTSAMIGNCLKIAGDNYYFITARASTNSITVDRNTGTATGQSGKVGGAFATLEPLMGTGSGGLNTPSITSPLAGGHIVYIRGSGSDTPSSPDYDFTGSGTGHWDQPSISDGIIVKFIGYNGRPYIAYCGLLIYSANNISFENFLFVQTASGYTSYGLLYVPSGVSVVRFSNVIIDVNGNDANGTHLSRATSLTVKNTGGGSAGSSVGILVIGYSSFIEDSFVTGLRGVGIGQANNSVCNIENSIVSGCGSHGIKSDLSQNNYMWNINQNTIHNNGGSGIYLSSADACLATGIKNNNITQNSSYGINFVDGSTATNDTRKAFINNNNFGTGGTANTSGAYHNCSAGSNDLTVDPQYTNAAGGDFSVGTNVKAKGYPTVQ